MSPSPEIDKSNPRHLVPFLQDPIQNHPHAHVFLVYISSKALHVFIFTVLYNKYLDFLQWCKNRRYEVNGKIHFAYLISSLLKEFLGLAVDFVLQRYN
jgi:hypothetical protein